MSAAAGPRLLRPRPLSAAPPPGLVDAHVHVSPIPATRPSAADAGEGADTEDGIGEEGAGGAASSDGSSGSHASDAAQALLPPAEAERLLREAGVARALACPPGGDHYAATNAAMLAASRSSGGLLMPAARLGGRVPLITRSPWAARRALRSRATTRPPDAEDLAGCAAVSLAPHLDGVPDEALLAQVREARIPVVVHAGAACPPAWVARHLLPRLPGVPVVLAHLGALPASATDLADAVTLAREGAVYLDTAAAWLAEFVALAVREAPGQVLFASAAPYLTPQVAWAHVAAAITDDAVLEHVALGAAQEVFGGWSGWSGWSDGPETPGTGSRGMGGAP